MNAVAHPTPWRLTLARACAWSLLLAGWVGIGTFALQLASSVFVGFAIIAAWLLGLGAAAAMAAPDNLRAPWRPLALCAAAGVSAAGLWWAARGGGLVGVWVALVGWALITALASGVVRSLRLMQAVTPAPPVGAATLGAGCAALALGDMGALAGLSWRLGLLVCALALLLSVLQPSVQAAHAPSGRCRAGLFDCSLPAWPAGAWRDALHWPTLLSGVAMLPLMAALPLMSDWCRAAGVAPQVMVLLHFAAMFLPALALRHVVQRWSATALALACTFLLALGAAFGVWADAPWDLLGLAAAHGAAWGLAWCGQLWAPARRGRRGSSPLLAAAGYAVLTLAFGAFAQAGATAVVAVHAVLALGAIAAWPMQAAGAAGAAHGRVKATAKGKADARRRRHRQHQRKA